MDFLKYFLARFCGHSEIICFVDVLAALPEAMETAATVGNLECVVMQPPISLSAEMKKAQPSG